MEEKRMASSPFHTYYMARKLSCLADDVLLSAFSSADISVYPYQIAAAQFALRSPYQQGVILCDEGSLGKTYEALLVASQKWYEGYDRQLLVLPTNLVRQWIGKIENSFTLPFVLIDTDQFGVRNSECGNIFEQSGLVITTYDFAVAHAE
jgi:SNF2 family DNA or RNA helicase